MSFKYQNDFEISFIPFENFTAKIARRVTTRRTTENFYMADSLSAAAKILSASLETYLRSIYLTSVLCGFSLVANSTEFNIFFDYFCNIVIPGVGRFRKQTGKLIQMIRMEKKQTLKNES